MEPTPTTPNHPAALTPSFTSDGRVLFSCASCVKKLSVKSTSIGKTITCPHCKAGNTVPDPSAGAGAATVVIAPVSSEPIVIEPQLPPTGKPVVASAASGLIMPDLPELPDFEPVKPKASKSSAPPVTIIAIDNPVPIQAVTPIQAVEVARPVPVPVEATPAAVHPVLPPSAEPAAPSVPAAPEPVTNAAPAPTRPASATRSPDGRILFPCGSCSKKLSVKPTSIGKTINCPHCKAGNLVPAPAADEPPASVSSAAVTAEITAEITASVAPPTDLPVSSAAVESQPPANTAANTADTPDPQAAQPSQPSRQSPGRASATRSPDGRILFPCGSCSKKLSVKPASIGKTINCPHCKAGNVVPDPDAAIAPAASESPAASVVSAAVTAAIGTPADLPAAQTTVSQPPVTTPPDDITTTAVATPPPPPEPTPEPEQTQAPSSPSAPAAEVMHAPQAAAGTQPEATPEATPEPAAPVQPLVAASPVQPTPSVQQPVQASAPSQPSTPEPANSPASDNMQAGQADPTKAAADRFIFGCYFCGKKMSVKTRSIGRSLRCPMCKNENIVPSPQQADADRVVPTPEQWQAASRQVAASSQVEVRLFFPCFSCHKKISAKIDQAGQPMRCPGCQTINAVPALAIAPIALVDASGNARLPGPVAASVPSSSTAENLRESAFVATAPPEQPEPETSHSASLDAAAQTQTPTRPAAESAPVIESVAASPGAAPPAVNTVSLEPTPDVGVTAKPASQPAQPAQSAVQPAAQPLKAPATQGPVFERGLEHLNRAQALAALSQIIPSAASKAAEIVDDSSVLPPVKTPGLRSEIALRHYSNSGKNPRAKTDPDPSDNTPSDTGPDANPDAGSDTLPVGPAQTQHIPADAQDIALALNALSGAAASQPVPEVPEPTPAPVPAPKAPSPASAEPAAPQTSAGSAQQQPPPPQSGTTPAKLAPGFIAFWCTGCQKRLTVKSKHAGANMPCPVCKTMNLVPAQSPPGVLDTPRRTATAASQSAAQQPATPPGQAPRTSPVAKPVIEPAPEPVNSAADDAPISLAADSPALQQQKPAKPTPKPAATPPPAAATAPKPAAKPQTTAPAAPAAKPPIKPAAPPAAAKASQPEEFDPFAALAQTAAQQQGAGVDMTDALAALAGGAGPTAGPGLDDLASALGAINQIQGDANADDITTALAHQTAPPDDGLVIGPPDDGPIQLVQDNPPANKPKPAAKPQPAPGQGAAGGPVKFIPTDKKDGQLRFPCTQCGHRLKVPPQARGKKAKCPACGTINKVPD